MVTLLYVKNVDNSFERAVKAGAKVTSAVEDKFYGDRMGSLEDPFGHQWTLGSRIEELTNDEISQRMEAEEK